MTSKRKLRGLMVLLALVAGGFLVWNQPVPDAPLAERPAPAIVPSQEAPKAEAVVSAVGSISNKAGPTSPSPVMAQTASLLDDKEIELCGFGPVGLASPAGLALAKDLFLRGQAFLRAGIESNLRGDDVQRRVQAIYLNARLDNGAAVSSIADIKCEGEACEAALKAARQRALAPAIEALVALADAAPDPRTYAAAVDLCHMESPAVCEKVSAATWAQLAPDNGAAWLAVMEEARRRKDTAAERDAVRGFAAATRIDYGTPKLAALFDQRHDTGPDVTLFTAVSLALIDVNTTAMRFRDVSGLEAHCKNVGAAEPDRVAECTRIAENLMAQSPDLFDAIRGRRIANATGVDTSRIAALKLQVDAESAYFQHSVERPIDFSMGCERLQALMDEAAMAPGVGERRALQAGIAKSGRPLEQWAQIERAKQANRLNKAAAGSAK